MAQLELIGSSPHGARSVSTTIDRLDEMLSRYLGDAIVSAIADSDVTEVYVNPQDGVIRLDTRSRGKVATEGTIDAHRVEMFLNAVATRLGVTLTSDTPRLEAELPTSVFGGSRLQGFIPPVTCGPAFNIRKTPAAIYTLDDYASAGILSDHQCTAVRAAIDAREIDTGR